MLDAEKCPGCGQLHSESMEQGADDAYDVTPVRCHACAAKGRIADGFENREGLFFVVKRRT